MDSAWQNHKPATLPSAFNPPLTSINCAVPFGSHACSCSRVNCTRTGRPTARDSKHRVGGNVIGAVAAVAAGGLHPDHLDLGFAAMDQPRQLGAQMMRVLRAGPDPGLVVLIIGDRAGRADRGVHLVRPDIGPRHRLAAPAIAASTSPLSISVRGVDGLARSAGFDILRGRAASAPASR